MKKIFLGLMACAALCACTSDDIISSADNTAAKGEDVFMKFNLTMSTGTRTATGETDTEVGQDYENKVGDVLVMVVSNAGTIVAKTTATGSGTEYVISFSEEEVEAFAGQNANVYVYCNPTSALASSTTFNANATYTLGSVANETPWTANAMLMSNAEPQVVSLPADLSAYNTEANPVDLGTVKVERSVARFDYKDGAANEDYTYTVSDRNEADQADITLKEVALVNMSNSFYHLRRVASTGSTAGVADYTNTTLLGTETANNWVIDTDAAFKANYAGESNTNFTYPVETPSSWEYTSLTGLTALDDGYGIWRYATENTIPAIDQQKKGIATIAVFKGLITPVEGGITLPTDGSRIYVFDRVLYGTWDEVKAAATDANYALKVAYDAVMAVAATVGGDFDEYDNVISQTMEDVGFLGYSPDTAGDYYAYYYYWNQHNDDAQDEVMGIMEYAVVRNNVYKLSVTDIALFGHPTPGTNDPDPDPVDPDDPIVNTNTYFRVDVQILPWTRRYNDIEF